MMKSKSLVVLLLLFVPSVSPAEDLFCGTNDALSPCTPSNFDAAYYIDQSIKYFQTMQSDVPLRIRPRYSTHVIRWEWPPWLLLTGFRKTGLHFTDAFLKLIPTQYDLLDCRAFAVQPFGRCHVIFRYGKKTVPIYEEFTFNETGEMTFIEAWSDYPSLLPMKPTDSIWTETDYWALNGADRLSTRLPGLGNSEGKIQLKSSKMFSAAENDPQIQDLLMRIRRPVISWFQQLHEHKKDLKQSFVIPKGDSYPYYQSKP